MMQKLKGIRVMIWDFDGTLYSSKPELWKQVRQAEYQTIVDYTGLSMEAAIDEFKKLHKVVTPSATQTVARLCRITTSEAARHMEQYYDRRDFVTRDELLITMFQSLIGITHYILANGVREHLANTLDILGINREIFNEIVTSEVVGENKPSDVGFRYILDQTTLPAHTHLMIGDREEVDLVPAKKLGMKTCLIGSDQTSGMVDVVINHVYEVANIIIT